MKLRGPELPQNHHYIRIVGASGEWGEGGEKFGCGTKLGKTKYGRKGCKFNGRRNSLRADALEHICNKTHANSSRILWISTTPGSLYIGTCWRKRPLGFVLIAAGGRVNISRQRREETLDDLSWGPLQRGEFVAELNFLWVLRNWELYPHRSWPNKGNIELAKMILQVREPIGGPQFTLKGVFRVGLVVNRFGKAELQNKRPCHALNVYLPLNFHLVVHNVYPILRSEKSIYEITLSNTSIRGSH